jgi:hypothetical protein
LRPDVDRSGGIAVVHVFPAVACLVDVVLDYGCGHHGHGSEDETEGHALDGREADVCLAESRVEEVIYNGDHDDEGDGIQVCDYVVGDAVAGHGCGLRGEVVVHLVV